jgi:hypothetical protein
MDRCAIVSLVIDEHESTSPEPGVTSSGLAVLRHMHADLGMRGMESEDEDLCSDFTPADATDVVLAALRAGLCSGLTIADLLRLLSTVVEQPIRPELHE